MRRLSFTAMGVIAGWLAAAPAHAQGALVQGTVAAAVSGDDTSAAFGGAVGYRFNRVLGLGVDISHVTGVEPRFAHINLPRGNDADGSATVFTTNVRVEIPTVSQRIIPYVVGGGGVASVTQSYGVVYEYLVNLGLSIVPGAPTTIDFTSVNMALTLGGGASFLISDRVSVDADLRILSFFGDAERNIGRFGGGVSYRF